MPAPSPPSAPRLWARSVEARRSGRRIVVGVDLDVRPGRVCWVVGDNGAGKTSLLRVLAGLDRPWRGTVGREAPPDAPFLFFQPEMAVPGSSTVADWERLLMRLLPPGSTRSRTALWPRVGDRRRVGLLSTGERKRLLLDALMRRPGSLLLDEPYEHLSPEARADLTRLLETRARAAVVLVATHEGPGPGGSGVRIVDGRADPLTGRDPP